MYQKDYTYALEHYLKANEHDPNNVQSQFQTARMLVATQKYQEAFTYIDKAFQLEFKPEY